MRTRQPLWVLGAVILGLALLLWGSYQLAQSHPVGVEFNAGWTATRLYLSEGVDPYGSRTNQAIQRNAEIHAGELDIEAPLYSQPFYAVLVYVPYALIDNYQLALALWLTSNALVLLVLGWLGLRLTQWRPPWPIVAVFMLFALTWPLTLYPLLRGQVSILAVLLAAMALWLLKTERNALGGVALALSSIEPFSVAVWLPVVFIWTISTRRWRFVVAFFIAQVVLVAGSVALQSDWLFQYLRQVIVERGLMASDLSVSFISGFNPELEQGLNWAMQAFLGLLVLLEWWRVAGKDFHWFLWVTGLTFAGGSFLAVTGLGRFALLLPAFALAGDIWAYRMKTVGRALPLVLLALLWFGLWLPFPGNIPALLEDSPSRAASLWVPGVTLLALYWVRYWALRPRQLMVERLRSLDR